MKRFILVLSLSAGLIAFTPVASAQESGAPVINADGTDAASTAGLNPVDNGTGPTLIYGDLSAGAPPVPIASEPAPLVVDPAPAPDAATTNEPPPMAEPAPEGELAPAPEETTATTSTEPVSAAPASETTTATAPETTGAAPETTTATTSGEPAPAPQYDPVTGLAIDPATGLLIDPVSGYLIDPVSGLFFDRRTGYQVHPMTGLLIEPTTGAQLDPVTLAVVIPAGFGTDTPDYNPGSGEMRGTIETVVDDTYNNATYKVEPPTDGPTQPIDEIEVPTTAGDAIEMS
jgi:hypothetical protein